MDKPSPEDILQDHMEWHGSPLHEQFLQSMEAQRDNAADGDIGVHDGSKVGVNKDSMGMIADGAGAMGVRHA